MRGHFLKPKMSSDLERGRKRAGGAVSLTGVSRRSLSHCYTQNTLLWAWRGPRHAPFHSHLRLHRTGYSNRCMATAAVVLYRQRTTNMPILPSRPSWLLQYLASSQITCPGNVKAIRSPCSKFRIVQGGGKRRAGIGRMYAGREAQRSGFFMQPAALQIAFPMSNARF